jgi:hypothetical protein
MGRFEGDRMSEPVVYGLRCCELGDAPGEIHDFVLESDYEARVEQLTQERNGEHEALVRVDKERRQAEKLRKWLHSVPDALRMELEQWDWWAEQPAEQEQTEESTPKHLGNNELRNG